MSKIFKAAMVNRIWFIIRTFPGNLTLLYSGARVDTCWTFSRLHTLFSEVPRMILNAALELMKKIEVLVAVSPTAEKVLAMLRLVCGGMSPILRRGPGIYLL